MIFVSFRTLNGFTFALVMVIDQYLLYGKRTVATLENEDIFNLVNSVP